MHPGCAAVKCTWLRLYGRYLPASIRMPPQLHIIRRKKVPERRVCLRVYAGVALVLIRVGMSCLWCKAKGGWVPAGNLVLAMGGLTGSDLNTATNTAELFNPATGKQSHLPLIPFKDC